MNISVLLIICWMMWIISAFIMNRDYSLRPLFSAGFLIIICLLPLQWSAGNISLRPVIILLFVIGCMGMSALPRYSKLKVLILACGFSFLFAAFRMAEWYEPVIFMFGYIVTYVFCFSLLHFAYFRTFSERLTCALTASFGGEIIYQSHMLSWTSHFILGDNFFLHYIIILIAVLLGSEVIANSLFRRKMSQSVSNLNLPGS